jgi:glycosyltransferase involved in cell wall biosynthesis
VRVLHVFPTFEAGGAQLRTLRVIGGLPDTLVHSILPLGAGDQARGFLPAGRAVELLEPPPRRGSWATTRDLGARLRALRPDLLCTYNWGSIDAALAARLAGGPPLVHHEDGFGREELDRPLRRRSLYRRWVLGEARAVIVPSTRLQQVARQHWHLPAERLHLVPNGVDLARYGPADGQPELRRRLDIPATAPLLGSVGGLRPEKNFGRLLDVFAALPPSLGAHLLLVGDGVERAALEARAARSECRGRIHFAGLQTDPLPYYRSFDLFALTSDTEQMPLALVEAMACSLPAIASAVGDTSRVLPPEQAPFVVPLTDPRAVPRLAEAAARLLGDAPLRATLGRANRARAEAEYALETMLRRYGALYGAALGPGKARVAGLD